MPADNSKKYERITLTISYRARERALWKRANSRRSWMVMTSFQTPSSTTPTSRMLPTTASSTILASGPPPHSDRGRQIKTVRHWEILLSAFCVLFWKCITMLYKHEVELFFFPSSFYQLTVKKLHFSRRSVFAFVERLSSCFTVIGSAISEQ